MKSSSSHPVFFFTFCALLLGSSLLLACHQESASDKHGSAHTPEQHSMAGTQHTPPSGNHAAHDASMEQASNPQGLNHRLTVGGATLEVQNAWVRPTVAGQTATGAFMHLTASENLTLRRASSSVSQVTEVHEMAMENGVMKMRELTQGLPLPKGSTVALKPGGYHIMLMDLKAPIQNGDKVPLELEFIDAQGQSHKSSLTAQAKLP